MIEKYKEFNEDKDYYDDEYYGHNQEDGMEHITYLIRTTLRNKGIDDFTVDYRGYDICISVFCYPLERLTDLIKIFEVLKKLKTDIIPQYESEFDIYQTKKGDSVLEFNFFYNEDYLDLSNELPKSKDIGDLPF